MSEHERSIVVDAPVHKCFRMWRNFENFPSFMSHVKEVKMQEDGMSHWRGKIAGIEQEWDAQTIRLEEDSLIAWTSTTGLHNGGEVKFEPIDEGTRITVHIDYTPPISIVGKAADAIYISRQFDEDLEHDLKNFKSSVEHSA